MRLADALRIGAARSLGGAAPHDPLRRLRLNRDLAGCAPEAVDDVAAPCALPRGEREVLVALVDEQRAADQAGEEVVDLYPEVVALVVGEQVAAGAAGELRAAGNRAD